MKISVAEGLVLGSDFVTSTSAVLGKKRSGKTYCAQKIAEGLLAAKQQVVVIDLTSAWWGLRSSADGKSPGYPITIFGGRHGDVPLEATAGAMLAEAIVADRFSAVLDVRLLKKGQRIHFIADFLEALYDKNTAAMHLFMDEADAYIPQRGFSPEEARALGAADELVRRGGIGGIGVTMISQRAQVLNKNVLSQVDTLSVLRMNHPKDIDAVEDWMSNHAGQPLIKEILTSLSALPRGDAWYLDPEHKLFKRVTVAGKSTYDSGRTPKVGERVVPPKVLAKIDLEHLGARIAATVEQAKANDPKELKQQVTALRKELERVGKGQDRAEDNEKANHAENLKLRSEVAELKKKLVTRVDAENIELRSEVAELKKKLATRVEFAQKIVSRAETVLNKHDAAVSRHHQAYQAALESYTTQSKAAASAVLVAIDDLRTAFAVHGDVKRTPPRPSPAPAVPHGDARDVKRTPPRPSPASAAPRPSPAPAAPRRDVQRLDKSMILWTPGLNGSNGASAADPNFQPAHLRLLSAIGWWEAIGVPSPDLGGVAFIAGTTTKSSAFNNNRSRLRAAGYIAYPEAGRVVLTEAGRKIAPPPSIPLTNDALHDAVLKKVTPAVWRLLTVLIEAYPNEVSLEDLAKHAGTSTSSSAFNNNRSWLRARELSTYPRTGFVRAAELLFPEAS